jgi:RNA-binding protein
MPLSTRQKKHLRGLSHALHPVVAVGDKGLTDNVLAEIETALDHHELIKVKLRGDRPTRAAWTEQIAARSGAERVQSIGQVACFYRRNPDKAGITLPEA